MHNSQSEIKNVSRAIIGVPEVMRYVAGTAKFVEIEPIQLDFAKELGCIDGRRTTPGIGFPGGGVGVTANLFATLHYFHVELESTDDPRAAIFPQLFGFSEVVGLIERCMGGQSYHTDDEAVDDPVACRGCKHAMACVQGGYGLGEENRARMGEYLKDLKVREKAGDPRVYASVYHGAHEEKAILRVLSDASLGEYIAIPPTDGTFSAFVVNEVMGKEVLNYVGNQFYKEKFLDFKSLGITKEEFLSHLVSNSYHHLRRTAPTIAHDLPVFDVIHSGKGKVDVVHSPLRY